MPKARVFALSAILAFSGIAVALLAPLTVSASCATNHISLYVDPNGGGGGAQSFCLESGSLPNLNNLPGPCPQFLHANSWNDCVSSVRITLDLTHCVATYSNANYGGLMTKYWGQIQNDALFNVSPQDVMSSIKYYSKNPPTPVGNC